MGLDMYAYRVKKGSIEKPVDFVIPENTEGHEEIHYWRKHPNLHGWMEKLYYEKGGKAESFNLVNVQLTKLDIDRLEYDITGNDLPETRGFFFGQSSFEDKEGDLEFIKQAREIFEGEDELYYTSWW